MKRKSLPSCHLMLYGEPFPVRMSHQLADAAADPGVSAPLRRIMRPASMPIGNASLRKPAIRAG